MDYTVIVLGIIIVFLVYYLYVNYIGAVKTMAKSADLNSVQPTITNIDKPANLNYSYGVWLYVNSWNNSSTKTIFGRTNNIRLYLEQNTPTLKCDITTTSNQNETIIITDNYPLQKWVYIIVSVDGRIVDCYINGKLVKSQKLNNDTTQPGDAVASPIIMGNFDATLANLTRTITPMDPQTAWNNYNKGNGMSGSGGLFSMGSYGANLSLIKDSIQFSNIKLF
jgi:hypothetical protein